MAEITFESLPRAVGELLQKVDLLLAQYQSTPEPDRLLTIDELIGHLPEHPARQTIYQWVTDRKVPYEKYGKRLYFRRSAIDNWMANGRRPYSRS